MFEHINSCRKGSGMAIVLLKNTLYKPFSEQTAQLIYDHFHEKG